MKCHRKKKNLIDFFREGRQRKRRSAGGRQREEPPNLGEINGKVHATLRANEAGETVGDVQYGFAVSAGQLDLCGINAVGSGAALLLLWVSQQLRWEHLWQVALRAHEFC